MVRQIPGFPSTCTNFLLRDLLYIALVQQVFNLYLVRSFGFLESRLPRVYNRLSVVLLLLGSPGGLDLKGIGNS